MPLYHKALAGLGEIFGSAHIIVANVRGNLGLAMMQLPAFEEQKAGCEMVKAAFAFLSGPPNNLPAKHR